MNCNSTLFLKPLFFLIFLMLTFASFNSSAKEYFVNAANVTGIEDGSEASPFSTIAEATALAKAGDVKCA